MFILAIVIAVIAVIIAILAIVFRRLHASRDGDNRYYEGGYHTLSWIGGIVSAILGALAILFFILSSFFTQDVGEASVLRDWTGNIIGTETTPGAHNKAPWVDVVTFDIRNQRVVYVGGAGSDSDGDNSGGQTDGPQITVQDGQGVTANIDVTIRYSIEPSAVTDIYKQYLNADNLRAKLIFNDIRSVVRSVPGRFDTLELLTNRNAVQAAILTALEEKWKDDGIIVEDVALQEIRYGKTVTAAFASAQEAQIQVQTEQAKLEATKVSAQQKVVQAQAEADANQILAASLTDRVLQQRYLDTLAKLAKEGNLVVVPEGFGGIVNVSK